MAFDSYSSLKTSIGSWAQRIDSDFDAIAGDLVTLCEDMLNNGSDAVSPLRVKEMEASASVTLTDGVGTLPSDYLGYREAKDSQGRTLTPAAPSFAGQETLYATGGTGLYFAIKGGNIVTYPADAGPLTLEYWQKIPALSDANPTNWLLAKSPRVYLFGALMNAEAFMMEDERIPLWARFYQQAVSGLVSSDTLGKYARASVQTSGPRF